VIFIAALCNNLDQCNWLCTMNDKPKQLCVRKQ